MFADKTCFFSKYEYYTTHYIVCSAFCCLCMCCCATTIQITIPSPAAACTVLAKMRSQAFLPLRNEPYDFAVVHAYDDLNKNMTADLNSIHSTVVNNVSKIWIEQGFLKRPDGNGIQCEKRKLFYDTLRSFEHTIIKTCLISGHISMVSLHFLLRRFLKKKKMGKEFFSHPTLFESSLTWTYGRLHNS